MKVEGQICIASFGGIDGLGTCDTECQWEHKNCPNSKKETKENETI